MTMPAETVVVPREPTEAMIEAVKHHWPLGYSEGAKREDTVNIYRAMLAAAPAVATDGAGEAGPNEGRWYAAEDIDRMVREIDVAMNGDGAAHQAKLCDVFTQIIERVSPDPPAPAGDTEPADVRRLVIAARDVAFGDQPPSRESIEALDKASEAFASRIGWDDEPGDEQELEGEQ